MLADLVDDTEYARALADCVLDPEPAEQAAFRSQRLVRRSHAACLWLIDDIAAQLKNTARIRKDPTWAERARRVQAAVGREKKRLEDIIRGMDAASGREFTAPNPRLRAMERLWEENMQGPVRRGRGRELLEEEKAKAANAKRKIKEAAKAARMAERAAAGEPTRPLRSRPPVTPRRRPTRNTPHT